MKKNKPKRWIALGGIAGWLAVAPLSVSAKPKDQILLETMVVGTSVGLVLGASTLPFYQNPSANLVNLAWGAAAGVLLGLGFFTYDWISGWPSEQVVLNGASEMKWAKQWNNAGAAAPPRTIPGHCSEDILFWAPLVSYRW